MTGPPTNLANLLADAQASEEATHQTTVAVHIDDLTSLIDVAEAAHRVNIALDGPHPTVAIIGCRLELDAALARFDHQQP